MGAQRAATVLLLDAEGRDTEAFANRLSRAGLHVFYTVSIEVGLRLSRDLYFDVVLVDAATEADDLRDLLEALARDGHRCVVVCADEDAWPPLGGQWSPGISGAMRRPVNAERLADMARRLARAGDIDAFRRALDMG